jgi:hypothetical protein
MQQNGAAGEESAVAAAATENKTQVATTRTKPSGLL